MDSGTNDLAEVLKLLGGSRRLVAAPRTELDYVEAIRRGVPRTALLHARTALGLSWADCAGALGVSAESLQKRSPARLSTPASERLIRLLRVAVRGRAVLGDSSAAMDWVKTPNYALGGESPLARLDTGMGTEEVLQILGRIEFGVYA
jgi:putative toxin-antitoxin system antitoxin component (TIGR02293 family)